VINAQWSQLKELPTGLNVLVPVKLDAHNAIVIIHVVNAAEDMVLMKDNVCLVKLVVTNAQWLKFGQINTTPNVLVPAKMDAHNAIVIIHVPNAVKDMVLLMECAGLVKEIVINAILLLRMKWNVLVHAKEAVMNAVMEILALDVDQDMSSMMECASPVKGTVINAILLHRMKLNVLAHAKEAVMNAVVGTLAQDVDQDTFSMMESAMLAMVAVNATSFKLLLALTELNALWSLLLLRPPHQNQLLLLLPLQIITITSPLPATAVVEQVMCKCL
jgi:hypothetical protein